MRAVIIEDEPLAVDNLIFYLKEYPVQIIGTAQKLREAVKIINKEKPDVIFLDINLSGENGFDLLEHIDAGIKIIFVTAYDEYAVRAFEVNALDYILKPLKKDRIAKAIERLLSKPKPGLPEKHYSIDDTIFLSSGNRAYFVKLKDIRYIQADSCYSKIIISEKISRCSTKTLKKWEEILPAEQFIRVHRSYLVNMNHVENLVKRDSGSYTVFLNNIKSTIEISRRFASGIRSKLGE